MSTMSEIVLIVILLKVSELRPCSPLIQTAPDRGTVSTHECTILYLFSSVILCLSSFELMDLVYLFQRPGFVEQCKPVLSAPSDV